jgi:glyoxylase-like metal-dependent hydrolase (beta-lactamase superfamily II)
LSSLFRFAASVAVLIAVAGVGLSAAAAEPPPGTPVRLAIKPVKPGLYMVTGNGGNVTVRVAPEGLILVDTKNAGQPVYDALMAQIRTVSAAPVKYVVDTHSHADHTGNNGRFIAAGAAVVAHEAIKAGLANYVPTAANPNAPAAPTQTYKTALTLAVGPAKAELHHYDRGHTGGDTLVYFPDLRTIAMGDELVTGSPTVDYPSGGDIGGLLNSLDQALKLDWDTAIAGHGDEPLTRDYVQTYRGKVATLLARVKEQVKAGTPKDQLLSKVRVDDLGWTFNLVAWAVPGRLDGLYAEGAR